ncbi:hypothetical protein BH10ACT1_BH10ACT1_05450 [soil metagenome]
MTDLLDPPGPHGTSTTEAPAPGRAVGAAEVASTALAVAVAAVVVVAVRFLLGWHNPFVLAVVAYGAFLSVSVARSADLGHWRHSLPDAPARSQPGPAAPGARVLTPIEPQVGPPVVPGFARATPVVEDLGDEAVIDLRSSAPVPGVVDADPDNDRPRTVHQLGERDYWDTAAGLAGGLAVAGILRSFLGWQGYLSTGLWAYLAFFVIYAALTWDRTGQELAGDRMVTLLVWSAGAIVLGVLVWMLVLLVFKGLPRLRPSFFSEDLSTTGPNDPGGGAKHAIIGTLEQVGLATVVVVPIAVLTAVYLHELKGRMAPLIRFIVDAMSGIPSIVAGLLVFTVWVEGNGYSGVAGSAALVILMLPTVTRTSEEILRTIPDSLREASLALGAPQWRVVLRVVVPTAMSGLLTAVLLGVARGVGETAPMLLTAFGSDQTNVNPNDGPQSDLPLFVWKLIRLPNETQNERGWTGLLVLVLLILFLFVTARVIAARASKRLGRAR